MEKADAVKQAGSTNGDQNSLEKERYDEEFDLPEDPTTIQERAEEAYARYKRTWLLLHQLEDQQHLNGKGDGDPVPGLPPDPRGLHHEIQDGVIYKLLTFGQQRLRLKKAIATFPERHKDEWPIIQEKIKAAKS
jgi:hypothetical protein